MSEDSLGQILERYAVQQAAWKREPLHEDTNAVLEILDLADNRRCKEAKRQVDAASRRFAWGVAALAVGDCFAANGDFASALTYYRNAVDDSPSPAIQFEVGCLLLARCGARLDELSYAYPIEGGIYTARPDADVETATLFEGDLQEAIAQGVDALERLPESFRAVVEDELSKLRASFDVRSTMLQARLPASKIVGDKEVKRLAIRALGTALCGFQYESAWKGPRDQEYWAMRCRVALGLGLALLGDSDATLFLLDVETDAGLTEEKTPKSLVLGAFGRPMLGEQRDPQSDVDLLLDLYWSHSVGFWPWLVPEVRRLLADAEVQLDRACRGEDPADPAIGSYFRALEAQVLQVLEDLFRPKAAPRLPGRSSPFDTLMNWNSPSNSDSLQQEFKADVLARLMVHELADWESVAKFLLEELPRFWRDEGFSTMRVIKAAHGLHRGTPAKPEDAKRLRARLLDQDQSAIIPRLTDIHIHLTRSKAV